MVCAARSVARTIGFDNDSFNINLNGSSVGDVWQCHFAYFSTETCFACTPTTCLFCYFFAHCEVFCVPAKHLLFLLFSDTSVVRFSMDDACSMHVLQVNSCRDAVSTTENWPEKRKTWRTMVLIYNGWHDQWSEMDDFFRVSIQAASKMDEKSATLHHKRKQ